MRVYPEVTTARDPDADPEHQPDAEQDAFVQEVVEAGEYQNASEAIRDALRVLQQRRKEDSLRLKALRAQIKAGIDALDRGDFTEVDDADLEEYLERLTTPRCEARALGRMARFRLARPAQIDLANILSTSSRAVGRRRPATVRRRSRRCDATGRG